MNFVDKEILEQLKQILVKVNSNYAKINDVQHRLNEIENKLNCFIKTIVPDKIILPGSDAKLSEKQIFKLNKYNIGFVTHNAGYLSIEAEECEINYDANSKITIKNSLKNLYLDRGVIVQILNPINLRSIEFSPVDADKDKK